MNKTLFTIIGFGSVIAIPVAPAYFFGEAVFRQAGEYAPFWLAVIVGVCAATGMEGIGIYAGHTAVHAFSKGKRIQGVFAAMVLMSYVFLGAQKLEGFGQTMFFIAPLGYLILGIHNSLMADEVESTLADEEAKRLADKRIEMEERQAELLRKEESDRQERRDKLLAERQAKLDEIAAEKERLAHEERMAKITVKKAASSRQVTDKLPLEVTDKTWPYERWPQVPLEKRQLIASMTAPQLTEFVPHIAPETRRKWVRDAKAEFAVQGPQDSPMIAEQGATGD